MARRYNGKDRTYKKTFAERYIDKIMNDGVERSTHQVVDAIISYIENQDRTSSLASVPHKGKVSHYCSTNPNYVVSRSKKGNTYKKQIYVKPVMVQVIKIQNHVKIVIMEK